MRASFTAHVAISTLKSVSLASASAIICSSPCFVSALIPHRLPLNANHKHRGHTILCNQNEDTSSSLTYNLPPPNVLCIGETLWDSLPSGMYLGGAPSNVAVHLASLFQSTPHTDAPDTPSLGNDTPTVAVATCLGKDQLGFEARRRLELKGVRTDYIQYHPEWETGMAIAMINKNGDATYEFNTPAAWDGLVMEKSLMALIESSSSDEPSANALPSQVFVMGTIAARLDNEHGATSSSSLMSIRNMAPEGTVVLDVNLRSPWYSEERVLKLARGTAAGLAEGTAANATQSTKKLALLKMNEDELVILEQWCGISTLTDENGEQCLTGPKLKQRMEQLSTSLNTQRLCVTRGKDGAAFLCRGQNDKVLFHENLGYSLATNNDSDTVGAGDAFLAALIYSHLLFKESPQKALERACALGGYVAGCRGATPEHADAPEELKKIFSLHLS